MISTSNSGHSPTHWTFEKLIFEAFQARDKNNPRWADGLIHVISHDSVQSFAYHHQHAQYHLVLFWIENFFSQAARWMGVRELARLALDFIENSSLTSEDPEASAVQFVESLKNKRANHYVAQLECLLRCGLALWKIGSVAWRRDLAEMPRTKGFSLMTLIEHHQVACVESTGDWSVVELWKSVLSGRPVAQHGTKDAILFYRKDDVEIGFEPCQPEELTQVLSDHRL